MGEERKIVMQSVFDDFCNWYFQTANTIDFETELQWLQTEMEEAKWEGLEPVVKKINLQILELLQ